MNLESQLSASLMNSGFAEEIVYTPKGKSPCVGIAIVNRGESNPREAHPDNGRQQNFPENSLEIYLTRANFPTIEAVKKNFDTVKLPLLDGETAVTMSIKKIISSDLASWTLQAKK